ncbi:hypothetical protein H6CHR_04892 [Variovorax sp. PBL-H6]|nr:hypothetical protein H6CHR_04892 [Variovorax sp. PBL-H6]
MCKASHDRPFGKVKGAPALVRAKDALIMIDKFCPDVDDLPSLIVVMRGKYECQNMSHGLVTHA